MDAVPKIEFCPSCGDPADLMLTRSIDYFWLPLEQMANCFGVTLAEMPLPRTKEVGLWQCYRCERRFSVEVGEPITNRKL